LGRERGFLDRPLAPLLVIGGVLETQVPISDTDQLLHNGQTPKEAWINPQGGHVGETSMDGRTPRLFQNVVVPWIFSRARGPTE